MKSADRKTKRPPTSTRASEVKNRLDRYEKAAEMIRQWMATEDGYDERVWPILDAALKCDPIRYCEPNDTDS
jgi:hypothetical protein